MPVNVEELFKEHSEAVEAKLGELGLDVKTAREQLAQLEQKGVRRSGTDGPEVETYGTQVLGSDEYKGFIEGGRRGACRIELKALTTAQAGGTWSDRDRELANMSRRRFYVRDLLSVVPTTSGSVDWSKQTTRTNNAAVVAEEAQKPTSVYVWTKQNTPMRTIAHLAKLTRQALEDDTQLQGEIDSEMRYGLMLAEEAELLAGDGTGEHLTGLIPNATAYAGSAGAQPVDMTELDAIGLAILQASLGEFEADGVILHPTDWMRMRLTKTDTGEYLMGPPGAPVEPRLFGLPVAATQGITVRKFLTGTFKLQKLYDRMSPEVVIASENADDFEKNLYTMRCEERLGLAIRQPGALIYGDFDTALAA